MARKDEIMRGCSDYMHSVDFDKTLDKYNTEISGFDEHSYIQGACNGFTDGAFWSDKHFINPWIMCKDQLPEVGESVLVYYGDDEYCFNHRSSSTFVDTDENGWCNIGCDTKPICWMYLPNLPENIR